MLGERSDPSHTLRDCFEGSVIVHAYLDVLSPFFLCLPASEITVPARATFLGSAINSSLSPLSPLTCLMSLPVTYSICSHTRSLLKRQEKHTPPLKDNSCDRRVKFSQQCHT